MSSWMSDSVDFYRRHWWLILCFIVPVSLLREVVMNEILWSAATETSQFLASNLLGLIAVSVLEFFLQVGLIFLIQAILADQNLGIGYAYRAALMALPYFFLLNIVMGLGITLGLMLLIIPGIYVFVRWSLAVYFFILQKASIWWALKQSWQTTRGYSWDIFLGIVILTLISLAPVFVAMMFGVELVGNLAIVSGVISSCLGGLMVIYLYRVYDYALENPRAIESSDDK